MDDNSYLDLQNCGLSTSNVDVKLELGVWRTGEQCPDIIDWFVEGIDMIVVDRDAELKVNREDQENSSTSFKTTTSGEVEWTRSLTIKPSFGSRLYQKFMDIQARDSLGGYNGELYRIYSDGGFHFRTTYTDRNGDFVAQQVALNVKLETFLDTFFLDLNNTDTEAELSFMIEFPPIYTFEGSLPTTFGVPTAIGDISIEPGTIEILDIDGTSSEIVVSGATLVDADGYVGNDNVYISAFDATGASLGSGIAISGSTVTIGSTSIAEGDVITIKYSYSATDNFYYTYLTEEVTAFTATAPAKVKAKK